MPRRLPHTSRTVNLLSLIGAAGLALTACGNATETGIEQLIESQGGGNVDLDLDGGGFSMQTEEGGMTIDEDGNFVITDADGNVVTGGADAETGEFNVESDDGEFSMGSTTEIPEQWPSEIPEPSGLQILSASVVGSDTEQAISVAGSVSSAAFVDGYGSALESAGFTEESSFTAEDTINTTYSNGEWGVNVGFFGDSSENQANIFVYRTG